MATKIAFLVAADKPSLLEVALPLAYHKQTTDELGCDDLGGAGEEGLEEALGERGGYGNGLMREC
jgi:hypothetical protein